jgi:hypothetical protein
MLNEQANKPACRGNISAHTGGSTLDNGFFGIGDGVQHSRRWLKNDWKRV